MSFSCGYLVFVLSNLPWLYFWDFCFLFLNKSSLPLYFSPQLKDEQVNEHLGQPLSHNCLNSSGSSNNINNNYNNNKSISKLDFNQSLKNLTKLIFCYCWIGEQRLLILLLWYPLLPLLFGWEPEWLSEWVEC